MFAFSNLQMTGLTRAIDIASESSGTGVELLQNPDLAQLPFSKLLGMRTDPASVSEAPTGDFLPEDGNKLPQLIPLQPTEASLNAPEFGATTPLRAADVEQTELNAITLDIESRVSVDDIPLAIAPNVAQPELEQKSMPVRFTQLAGNVSSDSRPVQPIESPLQTAPAAKPGDLAIEPLAQTVLAAKAPGVALEAGAASPVISPVAALLRDKLPQTREQLPPVAVALTDATPETADTVHMAPPGTLLRGNGAVETRQLSDSRVAGILSAQASVATQVPATSTQYIAEPLTPRTETPTDLISTPVREPAWGEKLGERIVLLASNQLKAAEIRLTPAELGPLRVQVIVEEGSANVTFQAQHSLTREAIEQALPRLREMLSESGLSLGQADVSDQGVADGDSDHEFSNTAAAIGDEASEDATLDEESERQESVIANGMLDTFA